MIVKLMTEHHLEFLSLTGGCRGSSESTLIVGNLMPRLIWFSQAGLDHLYREWKSMCFCQPSVKT